MNRFPTQGLSLIELVITLAIVAILATLTVPSFSGFIAKSRRSDAMSALLQVQLAEERWRAGRFRYTTDLAVLGWRPALSPGGHYRLRVRRASATAFLATAEPRGVQRDDGCGAFAVDQDGPVLRDGFAGPDCWRR